MKSFYLLTLAAAIALAACSNDDSTPDPNPSPADTGLVIEQTEYTLDALDNRSATLTFSASADWTLTVTGEDADWLTVTPASGTAGSQTVELAARRNFSEAERIVRLEISCGKQPAPVTVTQHMTDITDFTDRFAPSFARGLQEMGHIYDAGKISRQDMEYLSNVIKLDNLSEYTEPLTSLQGIEYFESLRKLDCSDTDLTELVIRNHPSLIELHCSSDPITSLDVSGCTALKTLTCYNSELASLNVSGCTSLQEIMAYRAQLTSLDVSGCSSLQYLDCNENGLTSLKLSGSSPLQHLSCNKNGLTALSLSGCTSLIIDHTELLQQSVNDTESQQLYVADGAGLRQQSAAVAGYQHLYEVAGIDVREQSRRRSFNLPDHSLVRQLEHTGESQNIAHGVDLRRQNDRHRFPKDGIATLTLVPNR